MINTGDLSIFALGIVVGGFLTSAIICLLCERKVVKK